MSKAAELANLIGNINAGGGGVNRNVIINGAMNVAQRSTSETGLGADADSYHTIDRWKLAAGNTAGRLTMTQDSSAPSGFANSLKLDCTTADTSIAAGEYLILRQNIEAQNLQGFAKGTSDAKPFALSFYVKGNASATYVAELVGDDVSRAISKTFSVTTDWTRVELTYPADTTGVINDDNGIGLYLNMWLHAGSTYTGGTSLSTTWGSITHNERAVGISSFFDSTDRTFFITGVQLEVGQNPTEFEHEPYERTLAKCQRYYRQWVSADSTTGGSYTRIGIGVAQGSNVGVAQIALSPRMRANPSASTTGQLQAYNGNNLADCDAAIDAATAPYLALIGISNTSGFSVAQPVELICKNSAANTFALSAEL